MKKSLLFSIVMPTYNRGLLIGKAIESVISQVYENWELLIIDDGSIDNTKDVVNKFKDQRIKYHYQDNQERSAARNNGINLAIGDFICFLDSDDYYLNNFLFEFNKAIIKNKYREAFYFCNTYGEVDGVRYKSVGANLMFSVNYDFLLTNTIGTPRVCLPKTVIKKNLFDLNIKNGEDFELWMRLIDGLAIKYIDVYTQVFVEHDSRSINQGTINQTESAINLRNDIAKKYRNKISKNALSYFKYLSNLKLARTYFGHSKSLCRKYSWRLILSNYSSKKEALYMLLKSI